MEQEFIKVRMYSSLGHCIKCELPAPLPKELWVPYFGTKEKGYYRYMFAVLYGEKHPKFTPETVIQFAVYKEDER